MMLLLLIYANLKILTTASKLQTS